VPTEVGALSATGAESSTDGPLRPHAVATVSTAAVSAIRSMNRLILETVSDVPHEHALWEWVKKEILPVEQIVDAE
jgi:hypothetical protein